MNLERTEQILQVIDQLGVVSVKQLHEILRIGTYRHTCRVVGQLEPYLNVSRSQQKIVYLNKEGRQLIGSEKEVKKSILFDHMLLTNQAYIYYNCPADWKREYAIETSQEPGYGFAIQVKGLIVATKKKIIPDALFTRDGYVYLIEIDNTRAMQDNRKKVNKYKELWPEIKKQFGVQPKLCVFTMGDKRKKEFAHMCEKLPCEVKMFSEI
ncbi:replication-relaxation family protein [Neobacillus massiliamazoniensis]|uniref:Phage protein n=1 Tax=Neobacillus massiliamazoniensis TaxID=1499688 RepID=A0A0U1NQF7_9BACI|nr:replication-relaxation family protein [Neobacillus massiliamazoniensis]CRK80283.1 Phage protein [Neobacillus massiliamazoniensis]